MKVIGWKAWYADGSKYVGTTRDDWVALPPVGVLVVMLYYDDHTVSDPTLRYRRVMMGNDRYWLASGGPVDLIYAQGNESSNEILTNYPDALVKEGRWTDDHTFKAADADAMQDHDYSMF
jgi:hypothetical protein